MPRYFLEVAYKGTNYSGSQKQQNANSIQSEIEKAFEIFFKRPLHLTGASRTDAGVHALQNFFHFDAEHPLEAFTLIAGQTGSTGLLKQYSERAVYSINAILPEDISISNLLAVTENAHCRYDAIEREYKYFIYWKKNPFLKDRAYFFPYKLQFNNLKECAERIKSQQDFTSFSKRSTQVNNFLCKINESFWTKENSRLVYTVSGNRFLRGMVRGLVGTMLKMGRDHITKEDFENIFKAGDPARADFSAPAQGLFLNHIKYPGDIFI